MALDILKYFNKYMKLAYQYSWKSQIPLRIPEYSKKNTCKVFGSIYLDHRYPGIHSYLWSLNTEKDHSNFAAVQYRGNLFKTGTSQEIPLGLAKPLGIHKWSLLILVFVFLMCHNGQIFPFLFSIFHILVACKTTHYFFKKNNYTKYGNHAPFSVFSGLLWLK